ncbi:hypothetical protein Tco_1013008, partial [Tanacetum coccineum]
MISMMLRLVFPPWRGVTYPPLWLEGLPFKLKRDLLPNIPRNLRIVSTSMGIRHAKTPFAGWSSTKLGQRPDLVKSKPTFSLSTKAFPPRDTLCASLNIHNKDLRTEVEYFSDGYDEEREMEPRHAHVRETTSFLRTRSSRAQRQRERVVEFEDIQMERYTDDTLQTLGLHKEQCISGFIYGLRTRSLVEFLSIDLQTTYKGLMEKNYTWIEAREVATNRAPNDHREGSNRIKKNSSRDNSKGKRNRDKFSPYRGVNHGLLSNLSKSPREILAMVKVEKTFEMPPRMLESRRSHDMTKYCHFHEDHGHNTNDCHELRHQIKEGVKSRQFSHLMKVIKKGKAKASETQQGDWKK